MIESQPGPSQSPVGLTRRLPLKIGGLLLLCAAFGAAIGLHPLHGWYSPSLTYRLQTEAFLRGTLALQPLPFGQQHDWAWGRGSQQVWGLGVPLLRLPFELCARLFGAAGFPDRVVLLLCFAAVAVVLWRALADRPDLERACTVLIALCCPAFISLCRTRLLVYEEAVAFGYLGAVLLAALLLDLARAESFGRWVLLGAAAGFALHLRVTLAIDGLVTLALALIFVRGREASAGPGSMPRLLLARSAALVAFCLGPILFLVSSSARFGSAFETGQRLNVSRIPLDQVAKVFGHPFAQEPIGGALAELFSSIFLASSRWNLDDWYARSIHAWQSSTLRFRELYFTTFSPVWALVLLLGWASGWSRRGHRLLSLWSIGVFAGQALFYLRMPSMTSRYVVDFAPALALSLAALALWLLRTARERAFPLARWAAAAMVLLSAAGALRASASPSHATQVLLDAAQVRSALAGRDVASRTLPSVYRCGDDLGRLGIAWNGSGWAYRGDCSVEQGTTLYLPSARCLSLEIATPPGFDRGVIRVKMGLFELQRSEDPSTFCTPPGFEPNPAGIEIVYLDWARTAELSAGARPLKLLLVRSAPGS